VTFAARTNARAGAQRGGQRLAKVMLAWTFSGNRDVWCVGGLNAGLGFARRGLGRRSAEGAFQAVAAIFRPSHSMSSRHTTSTLFNIRSIVSQECLCPICI